MPTASSSDYKPLFELGAGVVGTVTVARGPGGAIVAHKRLKEGSSPRVDLSRAELLSQVASEHVVTVVAAGTDDQGRFVATTFVEAVPLARLLHVAVERGEPFPAPVLLRVLIDAALGAQAIADAVDYRERSLGIHHGALSTANVLVGADGIARITDFGIEKTAPRQVGEPLPAARVMYAPPEYLCGEPVHATLDVYALGVVAWTAFVGVEPWSGEDAEELVRRIVASGIPRPGELTLDLSPAVESVILRACASDPSGRYASPRELADALSEAAASSGGVASRDAVATFVRGAAGRSLDARARRVEDAGRKLTPAMAQAGLSVPAPAPRPARKPRAPEPKPWSAIAVFVLGSLALIAAVWMWFTRAPPPEPRKPAAATAGSSGANPGANPGANNAVAPVPSPGARGDDPPKPGEPAPSGDAAGRRTSSRGGGGSPAGTPTPAVSPNQQGSAVPASTDVVAPPVPGAISPANPYR